MGLCPEILDAGMMDEFARLFAARAMAKISDPMEMHPTFDDDEVGGGDGGFDDGGDNGGGGRGR